MDGAGAVPEGVQPALYQTALMLTGSCRVTVGNRPCK